MQYSARTAFRLFVTLAAVVALGVALIWPWPAPQVDWRTPLRLALAKTDCDRASTILRAAATAGSLEAHDMLASPANNAPCYEALRSRAMPAHAAFLRDVREDPSGRLLDAQEETLSLSLRLYVEAADFLCRQPYILDRQADHAALSAALPETSTLVLTLHGQRRAICIGMIDDLAVALAVRGEAGAKRLAHKIVADLRATDPASRGVASAILFLKEQYVADGARNGSNTPSLMRGIAWSALSQAAHLRDPSAVDLMIELLHKGRFIDDARSSLFGTQKSAYYWIVRSRRLGLPDAPLYDDIERALDEGERSQIKHDEELDWNRRQTPETTRS